jgi:hypothetical protein
MQFLVGLLVKRFHQTQTKRVIDPIERKLVFGLTAYMDETGHSRNTEFVGIAGLVASDERWQVLKRDWKNALKTYGIEWFHMTEFAHSTGQFKGWKRNEDRRREFFGKLVEIMKATEGLPVGSVVSMVDYRSLGPRVTPFLDPYYISFADCVRGAALLAELEPPEKKVAMVFAEQTEFSGRAKGLWNLLREKSDVGHRMLSYDVRSPKKIIPLQVADLVVYEIGHFFDNLRNRPHLKPRWAMNEIVKMGFRALAVPPFIKFHERNRLLEIVKRMEADPRRSNQLKAMG